MTLGGIPIHLLYLYRHEKGRILLGRILFSPSKQLIAGAESLVVGPEAFTVGPSSVTGFFRNRVLFSYFGL